MGSWHDPDLGPPIAAPLQRCAELLGVDLATIQEAAATVEPYLRTDGIRIWSLMQLERQLRPELYGRRRGGFLDRRRTRSSTDRQTAKHRPDQDDRHLWESRWRTPTCENSHRSCSSTWLAWRGVGWRRYNHHPDLPQQITELSQGEWTLSRYSGSEAES